MRHALACLLLGYLITSCTTPPPIPTASSIEAGGTAQYLTRNAPPPGWEREARFPQIDASLTDLSSWHYTVTLTVDGVFDGTQDKAQGSLTADVYSNELASQRRVILQAAGSAFSLNVDRNVEGVRISNDYYLVNQNRVCAKVTDAKDRSVADLTASGLIGGIRKAVPVGERKTVGKIDVWEYTFLPDDVIPPAMMLGEGGKVTIAAGDLWVAPVNKAVFEYTITLNMEKASLQGSKPITGQVRAAYQLVETGAQYNISIPNGC